MTVYEVCPTCGRGDGPYWVFPRSWTPAMVKVWLIDHPEFEAMESKSTPEDQSDRSGVLISSPAKKTYGPL